MIEIIKEYFVPGSIPFLLIGMALGVILLYRRSSATWGKRWLTLLVVLYLALSTPLSFKAMESALGRGYTDRLDAEELEGVTGIVILGGGSITLRSDREEMNILSDAGILRVWEGVRLYHNLDEAWVFVSGGVNERVGMTTPESLPMRDMLIDGGVPASRILLESSSSNTFEQALNLGPLLEARGVERFVMVTSPSHMRRAMATFTAQGLDPIPAPSKQHPDDFLADRSVFLPNSQALEESRMAMREIMALLYYGLRGWLSSP
ncbi:MAG TPA: YdcF family protein [Anaerolineae bacterium]|nr:YdcF family protein [Anaerolineae bacterium]